MHYGCAFAILSYDVFNGVGSFLYDALLEVSLDLACHLSGIRLATDQLEGYGCTAPDYLK
jgi:hypothetical protein